MVKILVIIPTFNNSKHIEKTLKSIPHDFDNILAIESGLGESWYKFIGSKGSLLTIESFGLSGTGSDVMEYFGFTVKNIKKQNNKLITRNR